MILPAQSIRARCKSDYLVWPFNERKVAFGMSYGLTCAGYDVCAGESFWLLPFARRKSFTLERITMPLDLVGEVVTKSTWARRFVTMPNTRLEPGWRGHITLEIVNHLPIPRRIERGMPIGCIEFKMLLEPTNRPYAETGKYQNQPARPVPAILEG